MEAAEHSIHFGQRLGLVVLAAGTLAGRCGGGGGNSSNNLPTPAVATITGGNNQSGTVDTPLPAPLAVRVDGAGGQPLGGVTVSWQVTAGGGAVTEGSTTTDSSGTTGVQWKLGTKTGTNTVTATARMVAPVTFSATARPGPLAAMRLTNPKNPLATGDVVQIGVNATDSYGNSVPSVTPSWSASPAAVATIDTAGSLTAVGPGAGFVTALVSSAEVTATLPIVVNGNITFTVGAEEVVFRYSTDQCVPGDNPDNPAKAVRLADNTLMMIAGESAPHAFALFGSDFASLRRSCASPILVSGGSTSPDTFDNLEWVWSVYRVGETVHALLHNEFHDSVAPNCSPGNALPLVNPCWYNSILYASSMDGGHTYTRAAPPAQVVAPPPVRWNPGPPTPGPYGYFDPTNVVASADGFLYSLFLSIDDSGHYGTCVMRTQTLGDPTSWRAWDGSGFNLRMTDPYTTPGAAWCTPVIIGAFAGSLTYNTYLGSYMLVADVYVPIACGTAFMTSTDLLHWSPLAWIRAAYGGGPCAPSAGSPALFYSSIIDHYDATTNFERPGRSFYLYSTRNNSGPSSDRDLVRVPVTMTRY